MGPETFVEGGKDVSCPQLTHFQLKIEAKPLCFSPERMICSPNDPEVQIYYIFHMLVKQVKVNNLIFCKIYVAFSWPGDSPVSIQIIYDTNHRMSSFTSSFSFSRIHADDCSIAALSISHCH